MQVNNDKPVKNSASILREIRSNFRNMPRIGSFSVTSHRHQVQQVQNGHGRSRVANIPIIKAVSHFAWWLFVDLPKSITRRPSN